MIESWESWTVKDNVISVKTSIVAVALGLLLSSSLCVLLVTRNAEVFALIAQSAFLLTWLFPWYLSYKSHKADKKGFLKLCAMTVGASVIVVLLASIFLAPSSPGPAVLAALVIMYVGFPLAFYFSGIELGKFVKHMVLDTEGVRTEMEAYLENPIVSILVSLLIAVLVALSFSS